MPPTYPSAPLRSILVLPELMGQLPLADRTRANRLLAVTRTTGILCPPATMRPWLHDHFASPDIVDQQIIVRTTNLVTFEGTQFNPLRATRPTEGDVEVPPTLFAAGNDPFCRPLELTPADTFGRVRGAHTITASNLAKYEAWHGVIIFDEHDARHVDPDLTQDILEVGLRWGNRVLEADPGAKYLFLHWNCLWKAGASIVHGHAQVAATHGMHFPKIEGLRRAADRFQSETGANYFTELAALHRSLGLTIEHDSATLVASLTPIKEREVLVISSELTTAFTDAITHVLTTYLQRLGVQSFNVALYFPPLRPTAENWAGFPYVARIVDRGKLSSRTTDMGAMELFGASVVSSDPFALAAALVQRP